MDIEYRDAVVAVSVFMVTTGLGLLLGAQQSGYERPDLYSSEFNVTLDQDNGQETVDFDNRSVNLTYESWNEFRAYYDNGNYQDMINTTSDGEIHTTTEVITVEGSSYRFRFRYRDDPEGFDGDFLRLYRIDKIQ